MNCQLCKYRTQIIGYENGRRRAAGRAPPPRARHRHRRPSITIIPVMFDTFAMVDWSAAGRAAKGPRQHLDLLASRPMARGSKTRRPGMPRRRCSANGSRRRWRAASGCCSVSISRSAIPPASPPGSAFPGRPGARSGTRSARLDRGFRGQLQQPLQGRRRAQPARFGWQLSVLGLPGGLRHAVPGPKHHRAPRQRRAWPSAVWWICTSRARSPVGSCWGPARSGVRL